MGMPQQQQHGQQQQPQRPAMGSKPGAGSSSEAKAWKLFVGQVRRADTCTHTSAWTLALCAAGMRWCALAACILLSKVAHLKLTGMHASRSFGLSCAACEART